MDNTTQFTVGFVGGVGLASVLWIGLPTAVSNPGPSAPVAEAIPNSGHSAIPPSPSPSPDNKQAVVPQNVGKGEYGFFFPQALIWGPDIHTSLVRRFVGAAEGNLNADGSENPNINGHKDPGNDVWNRGAFSYQFGNEENLSNEESDKRQFTKIKRYYETLVKPYNDKGLLTELETWSVIDLINQAPLCIGSEDKSGNLKANDNNVMDLLVQYKKEGVTDEYERIIKARVQSFVNPATGKYDTKFESEYWLDKDQRRRMDEIVKTFNWLKEKGTALASASLSSFQEPDRRVINEINRNLFEAGATDARNGQPPRLRSPNYQRGYNSINSHATTKQ
jgi:hypothetical protein